MKIFITALLSLFIAKANAQAIFVDKGEIEYEVKTNLQKTISDNFWTEQIKDKIGQFKTAYYTLSFNNNESIYKFSRWPANNNLPNYMRTNDENILCYTNFNTGVQERVASMFNNTFNIKDSIRPLKWKLYDELRDIAGFTCRKASTIINDSVYVFVFYTNDITIPAGPQSINGLPGTILGMTIPRLYTSWIATKVSTVPSQTVSALNLKKATTNKTFLDQLQESTKDWFSNYDKEKAKAEQQKLLWSLSL